MQTQEIAVSLIVAGQNDRKRFDTEALAELAASIKEHGLAQPITVRVLAPDPMVVFGGSAFGDRAQYEVVAGERRLRAVRDVLGWDTITCLVRDLDDEAASAIMGQLRSCSCASRTCGRTARRPGLGATVATSRSGCRSRRATL